MRSAIQGETSSTASWHALSRCNRSAGVRAGGSGDVVGMRGDCRGEGRRDAKLGDIAEICCSDGGDGDDDGARDAMGLSKVEELGIVVDRSPKEREEEDDDVVVFTELVW